jgi:hypothetical protein
MKPMFETQICIALTPLGLVIGKMAEGLLTFPRILIVSAGKTANTLSLEFKRIIGDPKLFDIGESPAYVSEDSEMNLLYLEETTGIKLVNSGGITH